MCKVKLILNSSILKSQRLPFLGNCRTILTAIKAKTPMTSRKARFSLPKLPSEETPKCLLSKQRTAEALSVDSRENFGLKFAILTNLNYVLWF